MPQFPRREPDIIRLAHDIAAGLAANPELFPAPPAGAERGLALIDAYYGARDTAIAANASARGANGGQQETMEAIVEWARGSISYASSLYRKDASKLQLIGWGPRKKPEHEPEEIPGQPGHLAVQHEGKNSVTLTWRNPVDGGEVSAYRIQRRKPGSEWVDVGTAVTSEVTLFNQEGGTEFEFQVTAVNRIGSGTPSNVVRAVL